MVIFADHRHENAAAGHLHTGVFVVAAQEAEHGADKDRLARVTPGALLFGTAGHFIGGGKAFFQLVQLVIHQVLQTLHLVPGFVLLPGRGGAVDEVDQILGLRCQRSAHKVGAVGQNHHRNRNRGNLHANLEVFLSGNGGGNLGAVLEGGQRKFILGIGGLRADGPLHRHSQLCGNAGIGETDLHGVTGFEQLCGGAAPGGGHGKRQGFGVLYGAQKACVLLVELLLRDSLADNPFNLFVDCNQLHVGFHILGPGGAFIDAAKHDRKGHLGAEVDQIQTGFVIQQVCARQIHAAQIILGIANRLQLNGLHGAAGQFRVQQGAGAVAVILYVHHAVAAFIFGFEKHDAFGAGNITARGILLGCGHSGLRLAHQIAVLVFQLNGHGGSIDRGSVLLGHPNQHVLPVHHVHYGSGVRSISADGGRAVGENLHLGPIGFVQLPGVGIRFGIQRQGRKVDAVLVGQGRRGGGKGGVQRFAGIVCREEQRVQIDAAYPGFVGQGLAQIVPALLILAHVQLFGVLVGGKRQNLNAVLLLAAALQIEGDGRAAALVLSNGIAALLPGQKLAKVVGFAVGGCAAGFGIGRLLPVCTRLGGGGVRFLRRGRFRLGGGRYYRLLGGRFGGRSGGRFRVRGFPAFHGDGVSDTLRAHGQRAAGAAQHDGSQYTGSPPFERIFHSQAPSFCGNLSRSCA